MTKKEDLHTYQKVSVIFCVLVSKCEHFLGRNCTFCHQAMNL